MKHGPKAKAKELLLLLLPPGQAVGCLLGIICAFEKDAVGQLIYINLRKHT